MGSTVINQRLHIGLQQLTALGAVAHSFLGPNKKHKIIQDDSTGESALVCTCYRVMEHLELACSVGQLANETIQAHQKVFHSGTCCLLFLAGAWSRAALECLHKGISIPNITSVMMEGLDMCSDVCRSNSVLIADVGLIASVSNKSVMTGSPRAVSQSSAPTCSQGSLNSRKHSRIKLRHSRHFCEIDKDYEATPQSFSQAFDIPPLAEALSHGCAETMSLVVKACRLQSKRSGSGDSGRTFDVSKLVTCPLPGLSEAHRCVLQGCVVLVSAEQASLVHRMRENNCQVVLIDGDLSENFRHVGFNRKTDLRYVNSKLDSTGVCENEAWEDKVLTTLQNNNVNLVVIRGEASERFSQCCLRHCILVLDRVRLTVLKDLAETTGAFPVTYATQLNRHCVGTGVKVSIWRECRGVGRRLSTAVNIVADRSGLVTVVLTSSVPGKLQAVEDQFWACAYRLHHALKDQKLLHGAGMIELLCVHHLHKHIEGSGRRTGKGGVAVPQDIRGSVGNGHRGFVLRAMADGWTDYISALMLNSGTCSRVDTWTTINQQLTYLNTGWSLDYVYSKMLFKDDAGNGGVSHPGVSQSAKKVYDNVTVKLEAWRKALDLVFLVLQTDIEVITGIDPAQLESNSNVMVL